jgi:methionyl-tRNA synthetase
MHVHLRAGDVWEEANVPEAGVHRTTLLPGLEVCPAELLALPLGDKSDNVGARSMADPISYDDFAKLEFKVAKVLEVRPHPNADRLLLLHVDVGDQQKQIIAGIRQHYAPEQLVGKLIVVVNNLEPAMLRGESSNGMLLAATSGDKVIVLTVDDPSCEVGARIK